MENAYGIGVKNRYDLFYDEDVDPFEILRKQEEEKARKKTEKVQCKEKPKGTKLGLGKPIPTPGQTKKAKEVTPVISPKPTENTDVPNKPRNRPFADRASKTTASFDENKDHEERKNFRNREDHPQFGSDSSSTFTVRNAAMKKGSQERDRNDGDFRRGRGGFRGRGRGGRGGRGGFGSNFEGRQRREFDRHSGSDKTGMRHVDKREGGGSNNWGDAKDSDYFRQDRRETTGGTWGENKDDFERSPDKKETVESDTWADVNQELELTEPTIQPDEPMDKTGDEAITENTESKENVPVADEEPTEEGMKEMTLDEWKREQEAKRAVPKYNLRKPGEGEDGAQWKKLYMLKKKAKEEEDDEEEEEEDADDEEFGRRGRQRQLVDIQINFNDSRRGRGRGGRGNRGIGPRGGGGTGNVGEGGGGRSSGPIGNRDGNPREDRIRDVGSGPGNPGVGGGRGMNRGPPKVNKSPQQSAPRVDDWNDFPSLVTA